jgi:Zn-finger nucleic acid-binding protein
MQCPNDNTTLQMTTREGIEIDYCPQCRGVWLDRGELDKIIERSGVPQQQGYSQPPQQHGYSQPPQQGHKRHNDDDDYRHHDGDHRKHKKEGFLGDLFDF